MVNKSTVSGPVEFDNEPKEIVYCYFVYKLTYSCPCSYTPFEDDLCKDCDYNDSDWFNEEELKTFMFRNDIISDYSKKPEIC